MGKPKARWHEAELVPLPPTLAERVDQLWDEISAMIDKHISAEMAQSSGVPRPVVEKIFWSRVPSIGNRCLCSALRILEGEDRAELR